MLDPQEVSYDALSRQWPTRLKAGACIARPGTPPTEVPTPCRPVVSCSPRPEGSIEVSIGSRHPGANGVSVQRRYPSEFRRRVLYLVAAGRPIAKVAAYLGIRDRDPQGLAQAQTDGRRSVARLQPRRADSIGYGKQSHTWAETEAAARRHGS